MRRLRRGMSLLEAMVALAIVMVISVMGFQVLQTSIETRDVLAERDEVTRAGQVVMSRLRRELQLAFLTEHTQAINSYRTVFVGLNDNPDRLYFASLAHQRLYRDSRESDQTEISIWAEPAPADRGRGFVLYHRQAPRIDEEPGVGGAVHPLAYNVRSFTLRYLDAETGEWQDFWDSRVGETTDRLPRAVQIGLVLIGEDPDDPTRTVDVPFLTTVLLEFGEDLGDLSQVPDMGGSGEEGYPEDGDRPDGPGRGGRGGGRDDTGERGGRDGGARGGRDGGARGGGGRGGVR